MCTRNALSVVIQRFSSLDPLQMSELSGAAYAKNRFTLPYCNLPVTVDYPKGTVSMMDDHMPLNNDERVLLLQYLSNASGLPPRDQWLSFLDLRGGPLHWLPFQREALNPLARHYGEQPELFLELGERYGGKRVDEADVALFIPVLPRLPLTFMLWEGDDEFPSRSMILFDSVAESYLSTAALYVMAIQAMIRIWFPGDTRFNGEANKV